MRDLTEQQRAFVAHLTGTPGAIGNAAEAARLAGYSTRSAKEIAADLLHKPHVRAAVDEAMRAQISGPLAAKAVEVLARILADEGAPLKVRLDAAKTILDRAGVIAVRPEEAARGREEKPPAEMSIAELEDFIDRHRGDVVH